MRRFKTLLLALCVGLLCAAIGPSAKADTWNRETTVTFHEAVEIPGQVLPAGTYVFKLADLSANRNLVQIWSEDRNFVFATLETIPTYRITPSDETVLRFDERSGNSPEALRSWFYPGETRGIHFIYSY